MTYWLLAFKGGDMRMISRLGLWFLLTIAGFYTGCKGEKIVQEQGNDLGKAGDEYNKSGVPGNNKLPNVEIAPNVERTVPPSSEIIPSPRTNRGQPLHPGQGYSPGGTGGGHPGTYYKEGSQGYNNSVDTGNIDETFGHKDPHGKCGNGRIEVLPQDKAKCPFLIYSVYNENNVSKLYTINENDGSAGFISDIGPSNTIKNITAIDFSPDGTLYAIGENSSNQPSLFKIDCSSDDDITASLVGVLTPRPTGTISDITFDAYGALWGLDNVNLYKINEANALTVIVGANTNSVPLDLALFAKPLGEPDIFSARINIDELNPSNGTIIDSNSLNLSTGHEVTDADFDYFTRKTYALEKHNSFVHVSLIKFDGTNYSVNPLDDVHVPLLEAIAVNRVYEECDGGLPEFFENENGVICTDDCKIKEVLCSDVLPPLKIEQPDDGIDNDLDGFANCLDADCFDRTCPDDGLFCTINQKCNSNFECVGVPNTCTDENDCTTDTCNEDLNRCDHANKAEGTICLDNPNSELNHHERNDCILGTCRATGEPLVSHCLDTPRELVPVRNGGCDDGNTCTADSCFEEERRDHGMSLLEDQSYECHYEVLNGQICPLSNGIGICEVIVEDSTISSQCAGALVFVTSVSTNGDILDPNAISITSLAGADAFCNNLAQNASPQPLPGTYRAWLSTSTVNAKDRVLDISYFRVDGAVVAYNLSDLIDGSIQNPISIDENGNPEDNFAWTGTLNDGTVNGTNTCVDWTSSLISDNGSIGDPTSTTNWTKVSLATPCSSTLGRLYCFQVTP